MTEKKRPEPVHNDQGEPTRDGQVTTGSPREDISLQGGRGNQNPTSGCGEETDDSGQPTSAAGLAGFLGLLAKYGPIILEMLKQLKQKQGEPTAAASENCGPCTPEQQDAIRTCVQSL